VVVVIVLAQVAAGVAAAVHVLVFVWETVLFRRPGVHWGVFKVPARDVEPVRLWSFNVGLYNLFLGSGTVIGLIALNAGDEPVGRALVFYTCGFMVLAGIGLGVSDRLAMSRPKGTGLGGAITQVTPALVAVVALALA
jgi:putative membrane protein